MKHLLRVFLLETKYECLQLIRMPAYSIPTVLFPAVFYLFFGIVMPSSRPATAVQVATYLVATYSAFGVMGASLFSFGVSIAVERGQGWTEVKRTTPNGDMVMKYDGTLSGDELKLKTTRPGGDGQTMEITAKRSTT